MDSGDSIGIILVMLVLITMSAYFSATETAFSSLNRIRMKNAAENGDKRAALVLSLAEKFDKLLSTILVGNNIVNIGLSSIATVFFINLLDEIKGPTVATVVITVAVLIFGEISPKSLAKESPEKFARFSAPIMQVLMWVLTPINFLFSLWKKLLSKLIRTDGTPSITEEELLTIVEEAEQDGGIDEQESELIRSAIEFNDLQAVDIFTPRVDVEAVEIDDDKQTVADIFTKTGYSRLPVYEDTIDNIVGIIHLKDFYAKVFASDAPLADIVKPTVFITRSMKIYDLLRLLQREKAHMAVIADEYGGTIGIVTMEDILEELVGEIWDEHDEVIEEMEQLPDGSYRIVCSASIDDLAELFDIKTDPESDITTVSGWVMECLGRIPQEGDTFQAEGLCVTVTKTDARRVVEITVRKGETDE
ncbi:MAG: HlyC/CorC family transporter [Ruminococcaceae bacterium]|nr:HlyC/CorC family transporter [Oscillospiraceae bacterium]